MINIALNLVIIGIWDSARNTWLVMLKMRLI